MLANFFASAPKPRSAKRKTPLLKQRRREGKQKNCLIPNTMYLVLGKINLFLNLNYVYLQKGQI